MFRRPIAVLCGLSMLASTATAQIPQDGYIGVFDNNLSCFIHSTPFVPVTVYVAAIFQGRTQDGITGAGFRITDIPASWLATAHADPRANVVIGNPLNQGVAMAWPSCMGADDEYFLILYTLTLVPMTAVDNHVVHVRPAITPYPGLFATLCDAPLFTQVEMLCGNFWINPPSCPCCIGPRVAAGLCDALDVTPAAWSGVKSLYR